MKHISLFSGIGGFDLAAEWVGWQNIAHCEIDDYNRGELKKHFPNAESYKDVREFEGAKYNGGGYVISGGFPCQDISISNTKGKGIKGERSGLWAEYARIIREIRPEYIVFENSPNIVNAGLEYVLCDLAEMGYDAEWRSFYASEFGYPHYRERVYGISYPISKRWVGYGEQGGIIHKIIPSKEYGKTCLSLPLKRFNEQSDFGSVQFSDGFSKGLFKQGLKAFGNSIIPAIAYEIFKAIQEHENTITNR